MNSGSKIALVAFAAIAVAGAVYMIDIDMTEEARLPDVELNVEGGNLPKFDAEVGSVDLVVEEEQVTVPDVEVTTQDVDVAVPKLRITPPSNDG